MAEPPIQNLDSVDIVGRRKDGGVDLFIVASGPLDPSPQTQRLLLSKVQSYLEQINTPAFQAEFQNPPAEKVRIVISCEHEVHPLIQALIERCKPWVAQNNARIELEARHVRKEHP
ncbi:hypothetical protein [Fontivita pretiosa]|jgi:hypothetical protein|uniref:hypothetical protein n=1 Tax=Fontivita pretiosa TaxID=2989684 RepID=UPI003D180FED